MKHAAKLLTLHTLAALLMVGSPAAVHASSHGEESADAEEIVEEVVEGVEVTLKLDLGVIEVVDVEPTRGRTSRMSFDLHLALDPNTDSQEIKALNSWHHRLREQALVSVRATEVHDFIDPELKRFRKLMIYRFNRLLGKPVVTDVLFANFTFYTE